LFREEGYVVPQAILSCARDDGFGVFRSCAVGLGDVSLTKLIFVVAQEAGVYRKNGLDVSQYIDPRAAAVVRRSGVEVPAKFVRRADGEDISINIGGGSPLMVRMTSDATAVDRVILSTTDTISRYHIMARKEITDPAQLKGKRIGFTGVGALTHLMVTLFARKMGWDPVNDISLIANGTGVEPMRRGRVDASAADEIARLSLIKAGYVPLVDLGKDNIAMAGSGVNVSRAWLRDNQEAARRFIKAVIDATALIKRDRQVAFDALAKWYNITDRKLQEEMYQDVAKLPAKPYPSLEGIKTVMTVYTYHEMRQRKPEDFFDASYVAAFDKSGYIDGLYR
jgi:ABC-type nitrate/sulfonate/bicarbonate transport system substrate-binding protein